MKVLIIDDDGLIRLIARAALGRDGVEVIEAASGAEGVRKALEGTPDVILLDMMMPGMGGPATLAALGAQPATATIPVIFLTATTAQVEVERMNALGAAGVLLKPFDPRTLLVDVRALLTSWQTLSASSSPILADA